MPAPVLQDYQYWFGSDESGISQLFGLDTDIDVVKLDGLEALAVRSGTRELPRSDGSVPGLHLVSSKQPIFDLEVFTDEAYQAIKDSLSVLTSEEAELHWKFPGRSQLFMRGRVIGRNDSRDGFTQNLVPVTVAFEIADPRIYGPVIRSGNITVYDSGGGGTIDGDALDWDLEWTLLEGSLDFVATNLGNTNAYPSIRFFGPIVGTCEGVKLTNLTNGNILEITATILTGQLLTANMDTRIRGSGERVIDLDGSSRYGDWELPRETFHLQPGDNLLRLELTGASTSTDVVSIVQWRDTYY